MLYDDLIVRQFARVVVEVLMASLGILADH